MTIVVTGSARHLGEAPMRFLRQRGELARGIDIRPSRFTDPVDSMADCDIVRVVGAQGFPDQVFAEGPYPL